MIGSQKATSESNDFSPQKTQGDFDFLIIGSGFGGSVCALRLSEKGYRVGVLEQGRHWKPEDFPKTNWNLPRFLWVPFLGWKGFQKVDFFKDLVVLSGAGVGGGSLVYAATLLRPHSTTWDLSSHRLRVNWDQELAPYFDRAERMLGVRTNPRLGDVDRDFESIAKGSDSKAAFGPSQVGIYFGGSQGDPYFKGDGPSREACTFCGGCMVGCRYHAKNTLDQNYLYLAQKEGAQIFDRSKATGVFPVRNSQGKITGYDVCFQKEGRRQILRAAKVIVAAGVIGTLELLLRCQQEKSALPHLSSQLGKGVRTNNEIIMGVLRKKRQKLEERSPGIAISSHVSLSRSVRVEPVRYSKGSSFMRLLSLPILPGFDPTREQAGMRRIGAYLKSVFRSPLLFLKTFFCFHWAERAVIVLAMEEGESSLRFKWGSRWGFGKKHLLSEAESGHKESSEALQKVYAFVLKLAQKREGIPMASINLILHQTPMTAHILGGCSMGQTEADGVVDVHHEAFHYPGLYVCDASVLPNNLGVNPSLTITAMAERVMDFLVHPS